jgi:MFS family permease
VLPLLGRPGAGQAMILRSPSSLVQRARGAHARGRDESIRAGSRSDGDRPDLQVVEPLSTDRAAILATIAATLLLRFASRVSFSLLVFALGQRLTSATVTVLVLEVFYLSELALAPLAGSASDRYGRKPFLLLAPSIGGLAALALLLSAAHFPPALVLRLDTRTLLLLLGVVVGRLLEGASTGINAPAALGLLTDATVGRARVRVRALTAFEVATIAGLALAIPFAGTVSARLGVRGFLVVLGLHLLSLLLLAMLVREPSVRERHAGRPELRTSLTMLRVPVVRSFLPAWCCVNAVAGIWITLGLLVLTEPEPLADTRFPHQLLAGGFSPQRASLLIGGFGLLFLAGMGVWALLVPRLRYTSTMLVGVAGLGLSVVALTWINRLGEDLTSLPAGAAARLLALAAVLAGGLLLLSGFPPAALSLLATWADHLPQQEGAMMGVFAFGLGASQWIGTVLGGVAVDHFGLNGLLGFSTILGVGALASILATRQISQDARATTTTSGAHSTTA